MKRISIILALALWVTPVYAGPWISGGGSSVTVVDALNSTSATSALSANQGYILSRPSAVQTASCVANALTFTPTAGLAIINATITQATAADCAVTMEDVGAVEGSIVIIKNGSDATTKTLTFTTTAGKINLIQGSPFAMGLNESLTLQFKDGVWYEIGRVSATFGLSSLTLGGIILGDSTPDAAGEIGFDGTDKYLWYGANSEDFYMRVGNAANSVLFGSNTSVNTIDFGAMNIVTTGTVSSAMNTSIYSADGTLNVSVAQAQAGTFFLNTYAGTLKMVLPAAAAGMAVCLKNGQGNNRILQVDTDGTDYIVMSTGARTSGAGDIYAATAATKNQICLVTFDATDWYVTSEIGTWAEE
jgi:hypothetical protein